MKKTANKTLKIYEQLNSHCKKPMKIYKTSEQMILKKYGDQNNQNIKAAALYNRFLAKRSQIHTSKNILTFS